MRWDGLGWGGVGWDSMGSNGVFGLSWVEVDGGGAQWDGMGWVEVGWDGTAWVRLLGG